MVEITPGQHRGFGQNALEPHRLHALESVPMEKMTMAIFGYPVVAPPKRNLPVKESARFQYPVNFPDSPLHVNHVFEDVIHQHFVNRVVGPRPGELAQVPSEVRRREGVHVCVARPTIWPDAEIQPVLIHFRVFALDPRAGDVIQLPEEYFGVGH